MGRTVGLILEVEKKVPEKEPSKFDGLDVEQLKAYAVEHNIDIGNSTAIKGILKKITDAEKVKAEEDKQADAEKNVEDEDEELDPAE